MKKRNVASLAVVPALLLLSGCGASSGDEYIGEWSSPEGKSGRLEITRQGESTFTVEQARRGRDSPGFSAVAALNDDGILVMEAGGRKVPLVVDEASGRLTFDRQEYIRFLRLFEAAAEGDTAVVKALLEAGAEVDAKCPDRSYCGRFEIDNPGPDEPLVEAFGATALVIAAANGRADAVNALLEAGAEVDAKTSDGATALIAAAFAKGGADAVNALLEAGAEVNATISTGEAAWPDGAVALAARRGDVAMVKALLEAGADVDAKGPGGETGLLTAVGKGDAEMVNALLEAGADVDAKRPGGETGLLTAVGKGDAEMVNALLQAGADVDAKGPGGETGLLTAVGKGDAEMVNALLQAGADVDAKGPGGETGLLTAVGKGDAEMVNALLQAGADVDAKGPGGETALLTAVGKGDAEMVNALLEAGADVDAKRPDGETGLLTAVGKGNAEMVNALLEAGADVDAKAPGGETGLLTAVGKGDAEMVNALLQAGADVDAKGPGGETGLLTAVGKGDAEMVNALLQAGADVDAKGPGGETGLLTAMGQGNATMVKALLEAGADVDPKRLSGEIVKLLLGPMPFRDCDECPEMVVLLSGSYRMGSPSGERGRNLYEVPVHEVTLGAFAIGRHEVTFAEWDACVADGGCRDYPPENDWAWGRGLRPVIGVNWQDAQTYVAWLSRKTGNRYRLPSESEWEYAARAGTETAYSWGDEIGVNRANCRGCGGQWDSNAGSYGTAPVGSFGANAWGLHDMHGNVGEWTRDCWNGNYQGAPADGSAWESGDCRERVLRGGSWTSVRSLLRAASRYGRPTGYSEGFVGFRVARTLAP